MAAVGNVSRVAEAGIRRLRASKWAKSDRGQVEVTNVRIRLDPAGLESRFVSIKDWRRGTGY